MPAGTLLIIFAIQTVTVRSLLLCCLLLIAFPLFSQKVLMLEKLGSGKWYLYSTGDDIILQIKGQDERFTATLTTIADSGFIVNLSNYIRPEEVEAVWRKYPHRKKQGNYLIIAGGTLVAITLINNAFNDRTVIDPTFVAIGAGISSLGLLWRSFWMPRYKIGEKWKLKVLTRPTI